MPGEQSAGIVSAAESRAAPVLPHSNVTGEVSGIYFNQAVPKPVPAGPCPVQAGDHLILESGASRCVAMRGESRRLAGHEVKQRTVEITGGI